MSGPERPRRAPGDRRAEHRRRIIAGLNDPFAIARAGDDPGRMILETIELAGVEAEQVVGLRSAPRQRWGRGHCQVLIFFNDSRLLETFRSVAAIDLASRGGWTLIRRWAHADGDARLDEEMCLAVARRLHHTFGWRLRARIIAIYR